MYINLITIMTSMSKINKIIPYHSVFDDDLLLTL